NQKEIQCDISNKVYIIPSTTTVSKTYTVDPSIRTYTCIAMLGGLPCKHQATVAVKYHEALFNFIFALSIDNYMTYRYIACRTIAKDSTFYASLRTPIMQKNTQMTEKVIQNVDLIYNDSNNDIPTADSGDYENH
ncbi:8812_t:CDS:2, partial [Racocetra persica]